MRDDNKSWELLSYDEKNAQLYRKQINMLEMLHDRSAISNDEFDKCLCILKTHNQGRQGL